MQDRFYLFRRQGVFYWADRTRGSRKVFRPATSSKPVASSKPKMTTRTWAEVMT